MAGGGGVTPSMLDRIRGCMLGGAVGDAMGAAIEFMTLAQIRERFGPEGVTGYEPAYGRRGAITDDTQMALFTAEGCIRAERRWRDRGLCHVPTVVQGAYLRWLLTQGASIELVQRIGGLETNPPSGWLVKQQVLHANRAPGNTCLSGLRAGRLRAENDSKGCGTVMRIAPAGLSIPDPWTAGYELAEITHGHPTAKVASAALAVIIAELRDGKSLAEALGAVDPILRGLPEAAETRRALESARERAEGDLAPGGSPSAESVEALGAGWIAEEALAIAVYCALVADDFRSGVLLAVNHGGDSDSTGAIAGNLLGTLLGVEAIPEGWLADLEARDLIDDVALDLAAMLGIGPAQERIQDYERYPTW